MFKFYTLGIMYIGTIVFNNIKTILLIFNNVLILWFKREKLWLKSEAEKKSLLGIRRTSYLLEWSEITPLLVIIGLSRYT